MKVVQGNHDIAGVEDQQESVTDLLIVGWRLFEWFLELRLK